MIQKIINRIFKNDTLRGFIRKEFIQALRDVRMRMLLFVMPLIQLTVFGLALSNEVKNIRLGFVHAPNDIVAKHLADRCFASNWFIRPRETNGDAFQWIQSGDADAVLVVPPGGLTKSIEEGKGRLQLLVDATNAMRARSVENYVQRILIAYQKDTVTTTANPDRFSLDVRVLYNPSMETAVFLVPGVMVMILCLLTIILTSMALAREKEIGTFETLISAPVRTWEILVGKTLPYFILGMIDVPLIIAAGMVFFGVPLRGAVWEIALSSAIFIATTVSVGTLISTMAKNQQQAMMGGFIFLFPAIQLSGIMFPLDNMPAVLKIFTYLNPLKYFVTVLRNVMLKGGDPMVVWSNVGAMAVLAAAALWLSFKRFHQTLD